MNNNISPYTPTKVVWGNRSSILTELINEARKSVKKKGLLHIIKMGFIAIYEYLQLSFYKKFRNDETFDFNGKKYPYLFHGRVAGAGPSWKNERCVNIPIVLDIIQEYKSKGKRILELGNVLSYALEIDHDVVDKYEIMDGVINEDIVEFKPKEKYDLIVSVLCIHHVGWNETPRDPPKVLRAIENLKNILNPEGKMILSIAWDWNEYLDRQLLEGNLKFEKQWYLKKDKGYKWKEVQTIDEIKDLKYDDKTYTARGIVIGEINKKT
ncbi:MAG TPA: hypothetical protein VFV86_12425 [Nitrososphaeraceae archaeon]|nr:hypothetical protein [Nitrososphaeraceae archaeon]